MQFSTALLVGFAATALANCNGDSCSSTDPNGVVVTYESTTTDTGLSTTVHPVYTTSVATTTDVNVDTSMSTIPYVTNTGVSPVNTETLYTTTTNVHLSGAYYTTTNAQGSTYAASDSTPVATTTTGSGMAVGTAAPMMGAIAMGALAFVL